MTCDQIDGSRWRLTFLEPEATFLMNVLARLIRHYREDVNEVSPALRAYWQNGISANIADKSSEESREVLAESRAELRSERRTLAESWLREFELAEEPWVMEMSGGERDEFVAMLNDRRLVLAVECGVAHEANLSDAKLTADDRRAAVMEIDVLGHFIMVLLGPQIYRP